jgi:paraquat-inducible protein B
MNSPEAPDREPAPDAPVPDPVVGPRGRWIPSLIWLIPLIAALVGVFLVVKSGLDRGPRINVSFKTAEGLEPGKTKVKYKDVDIGEVRAITLSPDLTRVVVNVELRKDAEAFAVTGTRFWVVRPRVAASGITGLGTLLSGAYIGADAAQSDETQHDFVGLETPPAITRDQQGKQFLLNASDLGSLDIGSPVYYRRIQVGQVINYALNSDGSGVSLRVFVNAPYDRFVSENTRFWHASGVAVRVDSSGIKVDTQSLAAVVTGGIAFQSPPGEPAGEPARDDTSFTLAHDQSDAVKNRDGAPITAVLNFNQSLRGLSPGAQVDFRGIILGEVTSVGVVYDRKNQSFRMPVTIAIYPERLGERFRSGNDKTDLDRKAEIISRMVDHGLRAQLRTGNLITGQLYVALDFFPKASPAKMDPSKQPLELPTLANSLDELQVQVSDIARKIDKIPFEQIGNNLNGALVNANKLFDQLNGEIAPEAKATLSSAKQTFDTAQRTLQEDSPLQSDVRQAMHELTRTAQSLNVLADYLERHPESLLRGKAPDQGDSK